MQSSRYILEPYSGRNSRHSCPHCGKTKEFTRYVDTRTGEQLPDHVGRCNRVDKCAYHYTPKQYFSDNGLKPEKEKVYIPESRSPRSVSYIHNKTFIASLTKYDENNLVKYLNLLFDAETVNHLINIYKIGTSRRYNGGTTIFWQIDTLDRLRTGKLIKYNENGHRIKGKNNWVHSVLNIDKFVLKQCLFGEHLLKYSPGQKVGIVESEKTAIILQAKVPELVWLATGGADGLNIDKVKPLQGRDVMLFPDASENGRIFQKWKSKADQFGFGISDYLEQYANDEQKSNGVDIADFLM